MVNIGSEMVNIDDVDVNVVDAVEDSVRLPAGTWFKTSRANAWGDRGIVAYIHEGEDCATLIFYKNIGKYWFKWEGY